MRCFLLGAGFGFAASVLIGCGNGITEQEGPNLLGGSGGQGGSSAGTGGGSVVLAGAGGGGISGSSSMPAEPDAGMGAGGTGGDTTGEFSYPSGCPVPDPVGIPGQKVAIQSFNFETSELVLKNISTTTQTIVGDRMGWQWCSFPSYWNIAPQGNVVLPPGKTYKFILINNTEGVWALYPEEGELAIYVQSGTFDEPDKMVSFVSWGGGLMGGREYVATLAELWTFGERVDIGSSDSGFIATGTTKLGSGYEGVPKRCLVAPPNE